MGVINESLIVARVGAINEESLIIARVGVINESLIIARVGAINEESLIIARVGGY